MARRETRPDEILESLGIELPLDWSWVASLAGDMWFGQRSYSVIVLASMEGEWRVLVWT